MPRDIPRFWTRTAAAVAAAAVLASSGLHAQSGSQASSARGTDGGTPPRQGVLSVSAGNLAANPGRYVGERVSVTAPVEDVYSASMFALR